LKSQFPIFKPTKPLWSSGSGSSIQFYAAVSECSVRMNPATAHGCHHCSWLCKWITGLGA
jgi:hypothetical protein